jgi:RNA polymerase sigma factor (sigma-70 family)
MDDLGKDNPADTGYFRVPALKHFAEQPFRFPMPAAHRQQWMVRAERLFNEIESGREYPYQYIYFRITDFRTDDHPNLLIRGDDLRHDLWPFIDRLAKSLPRTEPAMPVEGISERVLTLDEISKQLNVSTKTISRWRQQGLVGRRVLHNGRWQLGFPQSVVERFIKDNARRVERGSRFSQLSSDEKEDILRRAKRLSRVGLFTLTEVSRRIAQRLGRSAETVRYTIKNFDREHPAEAIFPEANGPFSEETKESIYSSFRRGIGADALAQRFHKTRTSIYRVINEMRARRLLSQPMDPIYHESFDDPAKEAEILSPMPKAAEYEEQRRNMKVPKDVPPEQAPLHQWPLLTKEQEQHLFRQFNFLKHQASKLRKEVDPRNARIQDLEQIEELQRKVAAVKELLINANLRLVWSITKKHCDHPDNFFELWSDGNMSLIRAVDKFNFAFGNKFSTYATWAIMKNFARSIPDEKKHRERYQTGKEELFESAADRRTNETETVTAVEQIKAKVNNLLDKLDPRERLIVQMRAGLNNYSEGMTLEEIGLQLNITKERVRQLHMRALKNLTTLAQGQKSELS